MGKSKKGKQFTALLAAAAIGMAACGSNATTNTTQEASIESTIEKENNTAFEKASEFIINNDNAKKAEFIEEILKIKHKNNPIGFVSNEDDQSTEEWKEEQFLNALINLYKNVDPSTLIEDGVPQNTFVEYYDEELCKGYDVQGAVFNVRALKGFAAGMMQDYLREKYGNNPTLVFDLTEQGNELKNSSREFSRLQEEMDEYSSNKYSWEDLLRVMWDENVCGNISILDGKPTTLGIFSLEAPKDFPVYSKAEIVDCTGISEDDKKAVINTINGLLFADTSTELADVGFCAWCVSHPHELIIAYEDIKGADLTK